MLHYGPSITLFIAIKPFISNRTLIPCQVSSSQCLTNCTFESVNRLSFVHVCDIAHHQQFEATQFNLCCRAIPAVVYDMYDLICPVLHFFHCSYLKQKRVERQKMFFHKLVVILQLLNMQMFFTCWPLKEIRVSYSNQTSK